MVKFTYDSVADALDITLADDGFSVDTQQLDGGTLVDLDEHGRVIAIELIRPARRWPLSELLERFEIDAADAEVLTSLWTEPKAYPFAEATDLSAEATASGELIAS